MGIQKPNLSAIWADQGAIIAPTDAKVRLGWVAEVPPNQWENWVQNRQDRALAYLMQKGLPEWDAETEYVANKSFVQRDGNIYKCIATNTGNDPATSPTFWDKSIGLGLGTAAFANVTTSSVDGTAGRVLKAGDFGLGGLAPHLPNGNANTLTISGMYSTVAEWVGSPRAGEAGLNQGNLLHIAWSGAYATQTFRPMQSQEEWIRHNNNGTWSAWNSLYHTGNLNPSTKADKSLTISAGAGLSGGGDLSQDRILSVVYGTSANTSAQGNDTRIVNSLQKNNNLSDLNNATTARTNLGLGNNAIGRANLGLGNSATLNVGTAASTVAAGNDSRITGAAQKSANLSDLTNITTARNNLGLRNAALANIVGTMAGGDIIERGSNSNGEYVRFADGSQICWWARSSSLSINISTASAGWFFSSNVVTFPAAFISPPSVLNSTLSASSAILYSSDSVTTTSATLRAHSGTSQAGQVVYLGFIAIGRWK